MEKNPLLSVVIPTRNRQKYAISCIKSILSINDDLLEVIVHDNSDTNELAVVIKSEINDSRLIYVYDSSPMSTVHNFNKSMLFVKGEYLCFIGDDDGVTHEIIEAAAWAKKNGVDAIVEKTRIGYFWPNKNRKGTQFIYPFTGKIKKVNVKAELEAFLKDGGVYYLNYDFPKVYHGIVRKECFDKINIELGMYFGGLSVDIFAAVALSLLDLKVFSFDYPLTIAGSSDASEQTHRTEKAKKIVLKDAPHFRERGQYFWADEIPSVYSVATIWAESSIQALKSSGKEDLIDKINRFKLAAHISFENPEHEKYILDTFLSASNKNYLFYKYHIIKLVLRLKILVQKMINRMIKLLKGKKTFKLEDVKTIEESMNETQNFFKRSKIIIGRYLQ